MKDKSKNLIRVHVEDWKAQAALQRTKLLEQKENFDTFNETQAYLRDQISDNIKIDKKYRINDKKALM